MNSLYGANPEPIRLATATEPMRLLTVSAFNTPFAAYATRPVRMGPPDGVLPDDLLPSGGSSGIDTDAAVGILVMAGFSGVKLRFAGEGDPDEVGRVLVYGWSPLLPAGDKGKPKTHDELLALYAGVLWVRTLLLDLTVTLGAISGVDGTELQSSYQFAKEITVTEDRTFDESAFTAGDDDLACLKFDASGEYLLEFIATRDDGASGTSAPESIAILAQRF